MTAQRRSSKGMTREEWDATVQEYYPAIYRFCFHSTGSREVAQDSTQNAFLRAERHFHAVPRSEARRWLYTIARNCCIDWRRQFLRYARRFFLGDVERADSSESELLMTVRRLVRDLPAAHREVFILRQIQGLSSAETAETLGCPIGTVKGYLKRAIDSLAIELKRAGVWEEFGATVTRIGADHES